MYVCMYVCVCVRSDRMPCHHPFGFSAGGREDLQSSAQRSSLQAPRIRSLINSAYLRNSCDSKSSWPGVFSLWVLHVEPCNVFAARRKPSDCKPNLHSLETHLLYSRLISCTRNSSVVLERLALSIWSSSVYTPFVGNPRVYPLCDPGPALSENLTSTYLS